MQLSMKTVGLNSVTEAGEDGLNDRARSCLKTPKGKKIDDNSPAPGGGRGDLPPEARHSAPHLISLQCVSMHACWGAAETGRRFMSTFFHSFIHLKPA